MLNYVSKDNEFLILNMSIIMNSYGCYNGWWLYKIITKLPLYVSLDLMTKTYIKLKKNMLGI